MFLWKSIVEGDAVSADGDLREIVASSSGHVRCRVRLMEVRTFHHLTCDAHLGLRYTRSWDIVGETVELENSRDGVAWQLFKIMGCLPCHVKYDTADCDCPRVTLASSVGIKPFIGKRGALERGSPSAVNFRPGLKLGASV